MNKKIVIVLVYFFVFSFVIEAKEIKVGLFLDKKEVLVYSKSRIDIYRNKKIVYKIKANESVKIWIGKGRSNTDSDVKEDLWYIQAGAYKKDSSVENCKTMLRKLTDENIFVEKGKKFKIVKIGPFDKLSNATAVKDVLKMNGFSDVFLSSPPKGKNGGYGIYLITKNYNKYFLSKKYVELKSKTPIKVGNSYFRGKMEIKKYGSKINVINKLSLKDYLRGVVPAEMSPSLYPSLDAIKAQAIAARTYVFYNLNQFKSMGFDICATQSCQVYKGISVEQEMSDRAVFETEGEIITYDGKPINALFTAYCGGHTEDVENVFSGGPVPYLKGVECKGEQGDWTHIDVKGKYNLETLISPYDKNPAKVVVLLFAKGILVKNDLLKLNQTVDTRNSLPILSRLSEYLGLNSPKELFDIENLSDVLKYLSLSIYKTENKILLYKSGLINQKVDGLRGKLIDVACICYSVLNKFYKYENYNFKRKLIMEKDFELFKDIDFIFFKQGNVNVSVPSAILRVGDRIKMMEFKDKVYSIEILNDESQTKVNDSFLTSYNWYKFLSLNDLEFQIRKYGSFGKIRDIRILKETETGRISAIRVIGTNKSRKFTGLRVRWVLGVKENKLNLYKLMDKMGNLKGIYMTGTAWGHGVGMCQIGAFGLASKGYNYKDILKHYYQGVEIEKWEF